MNAKLFVHSEVNANKLGFSGLSPKILFYKCVKTFYDKIKTLIESKDTIKYISAINYNLSAKYVFKSTIILSEIKFFMLDT